MKTAKIIKQTKTGFILQVDNEFLSKALDQPECDKLKIFGDERNKI